MKLHSSLLTANDAQDAAEADSLLSIHMTRSPVIEQSARHSLTDGTEQTALLCGPSVYCTKRIDTSALKIMQRRYLVSPSAYTFQGESPSLPVEVKQPGEYATCGP